MLRFCVSLSQPYLRRLPLCQNCQYATLSRAQRISLCVHKLLFRTDDCLRLRPGLCLPYDLDFYCDHYDDLATTWTFVLCNMANRRIFSSYTQREYAEMHLIYGEAGQSSRAAAILYRERFPDRRHPHHEMFTRVHNSYMEGRLPGQRGGGRPQVVDEDIVLQEREQDPTTSVRAIQRRTGIAKSTVHSVLKRHGYHPFHVRRVQTLLTRDYVPRVQFCRRMLEMHREDPNFFNKVLWSDESACRKDGYLNLHNLHSWQLENPYVSREDRSQYQFKINLWCGIFNGQIVGPVELPPTLNANNYLEFLRETLPTLLENVPSELREVMWFQNDGCPAHYGREVRACLDEAFPGRWIGRLGPILWPPRSPDLNPLDFFYWGAMKDKVYEKPIQNDSELRSRVNIAARKISEISLRRLKSSFLRRCRACIRAQGKQFEHLL